MDNDHLSEYTKREVIVLFRSGERGVIILVSVFFLMFLGIVCNYYVIAENKRYTDAAVEDTFITIKTSGSRGTIYDRDMHPLVNSEREIQAVIVPQEADCFSVSAIAFDEGKFRDKCSEGRPFVFRCRCELPEQPGLTFFRIPVRYSIGQSAQHIIGYLSDGAGVSGIEYAYNRILCSINGENSVTYSTDGYGQVLIGSGKTVVKGDVSPGVVLTIDSDIQRICEECSKSIKKGAIVVSDVTNGDILAMVSLPEYSWDNIGEALKSSESPMINRSLYSYSIGSIFKLVTACEGINEGMEGYKYNCTGGTEVAGQHFNCHKYDGHGSQGMSEAIRNSCNTYFIGLAGSLDTAKLYQLTKDLGFGRAINLCEGMTASSGYLPDVQELMVPAELANFSFGQGKLSATPLHINQFTAAIANGGEMNTLRIIKGITTDGENVLNEKMIQKRRVISEEVSEKLSCMMTAAVYDNKDSNASPDNVRVAAKTSTAQTGRFDSSGEELCHGWITGFFPAERPRYAVTVLAEDGGYGNEAAAPVFREIASRITKLDR